MSDKTQNFYVLDMARIFLDRAKDQVFEYTLLEKQDVRAGEFLEELGKLQESLKNLLKDRHGS